jgi:hypothetical protein
VKKSIPEMIATGPTLPSPVDQSLHEIYTVFHNVSGDVLFSFQFCVNSQLT